MISAALMDTQISPLTVSHDLIMSILQRLVVIQSVIDCSQSLRQVQVIFLKSYLTMARQGNVSIAVWIFTGIKFNLLMCDIYAQFFQDGVCGAITWD